MDWLCSTLQSSAKSAEQSFIRNNLVLVRSISDLVVGVRRKLKLHILSSPATYRRRYLIFGLLSSNYGGYLSAVGFISP